MQMPGDAATWVAQGGVRATPTEPQPPHERLAPDGTSTDAPRAPVVHVVGLFRRGFAALVDCAILLPIMALAGWLIARALDVATWTVPWRPETMLELVLNGNPVIYTLFTAITAIVCIYHFAFNVTIGATPGLRAARAQVINIYGDRPEPWRAALRCLIGLFGGAFFGLGLLWIGIDQEKRALHDLVAGTYVVRQRSGAGARQEA